SSRSTSSLWLNRLGGCYIIIKRLQKFLYLAQKSRPFALLNDVNIWYYLDYKDIMRTFRRIVR
ncbi:hypothetical protein, partial [Nostoc sp. DedSLP04]|uniref:hypothetical protein n=1 Tax=Nostoc sp. DedSLP04 TaxID=3075401 RepID=UPI002AD2CFDB